MQFCLGRQGIIVHRQFLSGYSLGRTLGIHLVIVSDFNDET